MFSKYMLCQEIIHDLFNYVFSDNFLIYSHITHTDKRITQLILQNIQLRILKQK